MIDVVDGGQDKDGGDKIKGLWKSDILLRQTCTFVIAT